VQTEVGLKKDVSALNYGLDWRACLEKLQNNNRKKHAAWAG